MSDMWSLNDPDFLNFTELERQITDCVDRSSIEENLRIQLAEFEMIQSMFSNPGELVVDDMSVIVEQQDYAEGKCGMALPPQLDFNIYIQIENHKFQITVNLPLEYPTLEPDIFARSDSLGRAEQHALNEDLSRYITDLPRDEICIYSGITWLQENALKYIGQKKITPSPKKIRSNTSGVFSRLWIYSHHIYSKSKRRELLELAQEYNLTGFSLPGRPGVICFEGADADCEDCWFKVKSMNWKKIACVKKESEPADPDTIPTLRRFKQFQELSFEGGRLRGRDYHMDFGEFYKYLTDHGCEEIFKVLFGVDGKASTLQGS